MKVESEGFLEVYSFTHYSSGLNIARTYLIQNATIPDSEKDAQKLAPKAPCLDT